MFVSREVGWIYTVPAKSMGLFRVWVVLVGTCAVLSIVLTIGLYFQKYPGCNCACQCPDVSGVEEQTKDAIDMDKQNDS